ncbi:MAG: cytochrome-c peroxidase [Crocinitomicaceae bacterium]
MIFKKTSIGFCAIAFLSVFSSCADIGQEKIDEIVPFSVDLPAHFPSIEIPVDNPITAEKVALGERLFFDPILSFDTSVSCASCHFPDRAFSDTIALSLGVNNRIGDRNAPSLINVAYATSLFRDGGAPSLEMQIITPIEDENEMHLDIDDAVVRLQNDPSYVKDFVEVFDTLPTLFGLTRAIAAFERTLIGGSSKYDSFLQSKDSAVFNSQEKLGLQLFMSDDLKCAKCHEGFYLSDNSYRNNGLYKNAIDLGRANLTLDSADIGKFRVPSLRNITLTAPYMHDGSLGTLEEVINHYAVGGKNASNQDSLIKGFDLSDEEHEALVLFLTTLTDTIYR